MNAPTLAELLDIKALAIAAMQRADRYGICAVTGGYDAEARASRSDAFRLQTQYADMLKAYARQPGQHDACGKFFNCCTCR